MKEHHSRILAPLPVNAFIINPQIRSLEYVVHLSLDSYLKIVMTNSLAYRTLPLPGF